MPQIYPRSTVNGRRRETHIHVAEKALGGPLPRGAVVHHVDENRFNNVPTNLVICPDQAYHMLLHARMRGMQAIGDYDGRPCVWCKNHSNMHEMKQVGTGFWHRDCFREYQRAYRAKNKDHINALRRKLRRGET
jgi:hypothetical protein